MKRKDLMRGKNGQVLSEWGVTGGETRREETLTTEDTENAEVTQRVGLRSERIWTVAGCWVAAGHWARVESSPSAKLRVKIHN